MTAEKRKMLTIKPLAKSPTGIPGMDEITLGGLPKGRPTLVAGGAGFDVSTIMNDPMSAHGLLMIQDRLKRVDASLEVTSAPGNGTQTVIEIPIEQQEG
jgi:sensor histidine kinase YesM